MPRKTPSEIYASILKDAHKQNVLPQTEIEESAELLNSTAQKRQIVYDKNLHDAMAMAAEFDQNRSKKDGYIIKEGWDLHGLIQALVILWRSLRTEVSHGRIEVVAKSQVENSPTPLDKP